MSAETIGVIEDTVIKANKQLGRRIPDLVVDGMSEREILGLAPAMICDRIHWDTIEPFDVAELVVHLGANVYTRRWSDGQHRVWVAAGAGYDTRESIREWSLSRAIEIVNPRVESSVPFRDLDSIPHGLMQSLIAACTDWLFKRSYAIRHKLVAELDLIEDEDVYSLMYLFVHDHVDRFDSDRTGRNGTLNLTTFMLGKMRTWPQDAARTAFGRTLVSDRIALHRANELLIAQHGHASSERDRAEILGVSVTELRKREEAISTLAHLRNYDELIAGDTDHESASGATAFGASDSTDTDMYVQASAITRALLDSVMNVRDSSRHQHDPLALACAYLSFWEGLNRSQVAKELGILPKTASAALSRVIDRIDATDFN